MFKIILVVLFISVIASVPFLSNFISVSGSKGLLNKKDDMEIIGKYIDEHPERIMSSLEKYGRIKEKTFDSDFKKNLVNISDEAYPTVGNLKSDISIVEFFDYSCGYCKLMAERIEKIIDENEVRYVFRDFPIRNSSILPSKYGIAVYMMDKTKFKEFFHIAIRQKLYNEEILNSIISQIGFKKEEFISFLHKNDQKINSLIDDTRFIAKKLRIGGTPAFVIGDQLVVGAVSNEDIKEIIKDYKSKHSKS